MKFALRDPRRSVAAQFDAAAPTYELARKARWYQAQAEMVLRCLPAGKGPLLDVGCGTGWLLREAVVRNLARSGVGLDVSASMLAEAERRSAGVEGLRWACADWDAIDDAEVLRLCGGVAPPVAVCVSAFHYFPDPAASLAKFARILAPSGRLLLLDRDRTGALSSKLWDLAHRFLLRDGARFLSLGELLALAQPAGFADARLRDRVDRWFWRGKLCTSIVLVEYRRGQVWPAEA